MARVFRRIGGGAAQVFTVERIPPPLLRDLFVGGAGDALFVFVGAAARENQVRVRIDEAGEDHASGEIEFFGAARLAQFFDAAARADGGDAVFVDEDGAVAE